MLSCHPLAGYKIALFVTSKFRESCKYLFLILDRGEALAKKAKTLLCVYVHIYMFCNQD